MSVPVSFPGLGFSFEVSRVAFTIGNISIYWYGLVIGLGMLLAVSFAFTQARRFGVDSDRMIDVIIIGFIIGIIGARVYYVVFINQSYTTFFDWIDLRGGGLAIYGGIIGAFVGAVVGCKARKVPVLPMLDLTAMGFLIGQAFGRWGNFFNQEAFGINTTLPWGMISPTTTAYLSQPGVQAQLALEGIAVDPAAPVHPTFLYESLWCALGFLLLFLYRKKRRFNGELTLLYVVWYGAGRAIIEGLRTDPLMLFGLNVRVSQALAVVSAAAALVIWIVIRVRRRGQPLVVPEIPPHTARVMVRTPEGKVPVFLQWAADDKPPTGKERRAKAEQMLEDKGVVTTAKIASMVRQEEIRRAGGIFTVPDEDEDDGATADAGEAAESEAGKGSADAGVPPEQDGADAPDEAPDTAAGGESAEDGKEQDG